MKKHNHLHLGWPNFYFWANYSFKDFQRVSTYFLVVPGHTHQWQSVCWPSDRKYSAGSCGHHADGQKCRQPPHHWTSLKVLTVHFFLLYHHLPQPLLVAGTKAQMRDSACRRSSDPRTSASTGWPAKTGLNPGWGSLWALLLVSGIASAGWEKGRCFRSAPQIGHGRYWAAPWRQGVRKCLRRCCKGGRWERRDPPREGCRWAAPAHLCPGSGRGGDGRKVCARPPGRQTWGQARCGEGGRVTET